MKPSEIAALLRIGTPPAPYGARRLARSHSIDDIADVACRRLPDGALGYLEGGGEGEYTLRRNREAFDDYEVLPAVLRTVSDVDTSTTIPGAPVPLPIALAPVGAPRLFQHEGELAVAAPLATPAFPTASRPSPRYRSRGSRTRPTACCGSSSTPGETATSPRTSSKRRGRWDTRPSSSAWT